MPRPDNSYPEGREAARQLDDIVATLADAEMKLEELETNLERADGADLRANVRLSAARSMKRQLDSLLALVSRSSARWSLESGHDRESPDFHE